MARMVYTIDSNGCHIWQKARNSRGYGVIWHDGKVRLAHRVAWFLKHGAWPIKGLVIDHICEVRACVNADHLRELTNGQNIMRAYPRGDEATERRRSRQRAANARYRARLQAKAGV